MSVAEKNLPAMRRQTMHMENATSIMMGSCKIKKQDPKD